MLYRVRILFIIVMSQTLLGYARVTKGYSQLYNKYGGPKFMFGHHGMIKLKMHKDTQFGGKIGPVQHGGSDNIIPGQVVHEVLPPQLVAKIEEIMPYRIIRFKLPHTLTGKKRLTPHGRKGHGSNSPVVGKAHPTLLTSNGKHTFPFEIHNRGGPFVGGNKHVQSPAGTSGMGSQSGEQGFWSVVEVPRGDLGQDIKVINISPTSQGTGLGNTGANSGPISAIGHAQYVPEVSGGGSAIGGSAIGGIGPNVQVINVIPGSVFGGGKHGVSGVGSGSVIDGLGVSVLGAGTLAGNALNGNSAEKGVLGSVSTNMVDTSGSILADSASKTIAASPALLQSGSNNNVVGIPISISRKLFKERQLAKTHNPFLRLMALEAFGPGPYRLCKPPAIVVCDVRPGWEHVDGMTSWCRQNCVVNNYSSYCDDDRCYCQCTSG